MEYPLPVMRMMMRRVIAHLLWIVRSSGKLGCVPIVPAPSHACSQECLQFKEMHFLFFFSCFLSPGIKNLTGHVLLLVLLNFSFFSLH